jgi:NAD(P)-dependent dehydrogenase (short-subunit alcohol dehydrogenase family)
MKLDGATAVITGGTGAIGTEIGRALAQRGADVARWDVAADEGVIACDVSDPVSVAAAFEATLRDHGQPTVLVNAAGVSGGRAPWAADAADDEWRFVLSPTEAWRSVFDVNVLGPVNTSREFARLLRASGLPGAIVNITSIGGAELNDPALTAYSASKAAANAVTRIAAKNFGPLGIRVNAVAPGMMENRMKSAGITTEAVSGRGDPADMMRRVAAATPVENRFARPSDIADAVLGLLDSDFVSGQVLVVDGGLTLRSFSSE